MSTIQEHAPGRFCWQEISTSDAAAGKEFYRNLFGWSTVDVPAGPMSYTLLKLGGRDVGGLCLLDATTQPGVPPHWLVYVSVADVDASTRRAAELGATVMGGPFDVMDKGRMSVLKDPTGAHLGLWQPGTHAGAQVEGESGSWCWNELMTSDTAKAGTFYSGLFGWTREEMPMPTGPYTIFKQGATSVGGMMALPAPSLPPNWMPYVQVSDCDAIAAQAQKLGGAVHAGPMQVPNIGRFAVMADPQGAAFAVIKLDQ